MKRMLLFFVACVATMGLIISCQKAYSLNGSTWTQIEGDITRTYTFEAQTCEFKASKPGTASTSVNYTYVLDFPTVILYPEVNGFAKLQGTIDGDNMAIVNLSQEISCGVFIRQ